MRAYAIVTITVAGLALVSCTTAKQAEIRPIKGPLKEGVQPVSVRVAEGHAQMALGNVGLAIEAYRKALRSDPADVEAMLGMAAAYDRMGRFDLSRRHYEMALAVKPNQSETYDQLAASLQMQGRADEAARVQTEIAARDAAPEVSPAAPGSVPVLPPPPVQRAEAALSAPRIASVAVVVPVRTAPVRLERLSMGEVALRTSPAPVWESRTVVQTARSTTIQFTRKPAAKVTLLNAARVQGLAARTKAYLQTRGFASARIGDAPKVRQQSAIVFAAADRAWAQRLAAQFGFALHQQAAAKSGDLTILLGRDAAADRALRPTA